MSGIEIERKFLMRPCAVKCFLKSHNIAYRKIAIEQYYLPPRDGQYLRCRMADDDYFETIKSGEGLVRQEQEHQISKEEFEAKRSQHTGNVIAKDRFVFVYDGTLYELDRFAKSLKGLYFLEVEFDSTEQASSFVLPGIFDKLVVAEVTTDGRFNNASLCHNVILPSLDKKSDTDQLQDQFAHFDTVSSVLKTVIVRYLEEAQRHNIRLQGADKDEDPEYLHLFRVTLRKTRALMEEFADYFEPKWLEECQKHFALLMKDTSERRDVDVMIKQIALYRTMQSKKLQKGLDVVEELLQNKQMILDQKIVAVSKSTILDEEIVLFDRAQCFLENASEPIVLVAMRIVHNRLKQIIKDGKKIGPKSDDKVYHVLRIEYKKLRYVIETMKPLIAENRYIMAIKRLKKMQILLGECHDSHVQRQYLAFLAKDQSLQHPKTQEALKKIDTMLYDINLQRRRAFHHTFKLFLKHSKKFKNLFEIC